MKIERLWQWCDRFFAENNQPRVVRQLYGELYKRWQSIQGEQSVYTKIILLRTFYEEWLTLVFICSHSSYKSERASLFKQSALLRFKLRLSQLYHNEQAIEESPSLSAFIATHDMKVIDTKLHQDIIQHRTTFDQIACHFMSQHALEHDERRRRFYRFQQLGYHIETLRDLSNAMFEVEGEHLYQLFYRMPSMLMHGHLLFSIDSLKMLVSCMTQRVVPRLLSLALFIVTKDTQWKQNEAQWAEECSRALLSVSYPFVYNMQDNRVHSIQLMMDDISSLQDDITKAIVLRGAIQMMQAWFSDAKLDDEALQHRNEHDCQKMEMLFFCPFIPHIKPKSKQRRYNQDIHYHYAFIGEVMKGLFSVYGHGIDLNQTITVNDVALLGSASQLSLLVSESYDTMQTLLFFMN